MGNVSSIFDCAVNPLAPAASDDDVDLSEGPPRPVTVEAATPLRDSVLWRLQRAYYEAQGVQAWSSGAVPHFVTTNAFIAKAYAKVILGLLRDTYGTQPGGGAALCAAPVHIIELGAGHGKLGYLIVETLLRYRSFYPPSGVASGVPFKYIMTGAMTREGKGIARSASRSTRPASSPPESGRSLASPRSVSAAPRLSLPPTSADAFPATVDAWSRHPSLRDFLDAGVMDIAVFDAERDTSVRGGR